MHILVLTKRQYTGKDLLNDRYGRLYEIPTELAARGHDVIGIALSYRRRNSDWYHRDDLPNLSWLSINAIPAGIWRYPYQLAKVVLDFRPDIIWACSDAFHVITGDLLSRATGIPLVIDLYDNYESFAATRIPGITSLFRAACRRAKGLTVVSRSLRNYVLSRYGITAPVEIVVNGIRRDLFHPRDRQAARTILNLPPGARLMGTAGSISRDRGIEDLFEAFLELAAEDPDLYLVLAGPRDESPCRYPHPRIIDLGVLPFEQVPYLLSALDVAVICNRDSDFGRHCFPLKLFEIVACGTPIVAARVGEVLTRLSDHPECLYTPGNAPELAGRVRHQLSAHERLSEIEVPDWKNLTEPVEQLILQVCASSVVFDTKSTSKL